MIDIIDLLFLIPGTLLAWITSFLVHELMHIKSQGINVEGTIWVHNPFSMTVGAKEMPRPNLFWFAGGIYSGTIFIIFALMLSYYNAWGLYVPMGTFGVINLFYGFWEGIKGPEGRYKIYGATTLLMIIFWLIHYWLVLS